MRFVHDDQLRALLDKYIAPSLRLNKIDADHLIGVVVIDAGIPLNLPVEARLGVRADDDRVDIELCSNLRLPLLAEVRQTHNCESLDLTALQYLSDGKERFDGLADSDV